MDLLKQLSTNEIVAQIISFLLLLFILRIFVWKKFLKLLDDRKEKIASEFKKIEEIQAGLAKTKAEYEKHLLSIEDLKRVKIQEGVREAGKLAEEIRKKAHEDSQRIIENARESVRFEVAKAKEEIREKIVELAIKAAEDVIEEKLTEEKDEKLVREFIKRIDEA